MQEKTSTPSKSTASPRPRDLNKISKKVIRFVLLQAGIIFALIWVIAGNDRLFRNTVPIEQRLLSHNEPIRKKAQQELLGMDSNRKNGVAGRLIPALEQEDPVARKWAAISLALIGPEARETIPFLLQAVSDHEKDVAQAARVALSEIGAPDATQLPSLLRTLQDPRNPVRCESALSIGKMGPAAKEAAPILIGHIQRDGETPVCFEEALAALAITVPAVYPPIVDLLSSSHVELRRKAANVLAMAGTKSPETIRALLVAYPQESDSEVRTRMAKALQLPSAPEPQAIPLWTAALKANAPAVRLEASKEMRGTNFEDRKGLPLIFRMMRDEESAIRRLGLETLRRSGQRSKEILQNVAYVQRDTDAGVRCRASELLIEFGAVDRVSISRLISDLRGDEDTARCAEDVLGLAGLFDGGVMHSMIHLLQQEKDPDVRSRAAHVLMHLGPRAREAEPALVRAKQDKIPGAEMALRAIRMPPARTAPSARKKR